MIHVPDVNGYLFHSVVRREAPGVGFEPTRPEDHRLSKPTPYLDAQHVPHVFLGNPGIQTSVSSHRD